MPFLDLPSFIKTKVKYQKVKKKCYEYRLTKKMMINSTYQVRKMMCYGFTSSLTKSLA